MAELIVECVKWKHPPEDLLEYQYCQQKTLKCISTLEDAMSPVDVVWKQVLNNHVLLIHTKDDNNFKYLRDIFEEEVFLDVSDMRNALRGDRHTEAAEMIQPTDNIFDHRVPIAVLEMTTDQKLTEKSTHLVRALKALPRNIWKRIMFFVGGHNDLGKTDVLKDDLNEITDIQNADGDLRKFQSRLHKSMNKLIDRMEEKCKEQKVEPMNSKMNGNILQILMYVSNTFANIKRILEAKDDEDVVNEELQNEFDKMQNQGYAGHVFLNQRLTIYFESTAKLQDVDAACSKAQKYFRHVNACTLSESSEIKQYTLRHDVIATNPCERKGRLGAFAKLNKRKTVALSAGHFAQNTDKVTVNGSMIGHCVYPSEEQRSILSNDICVIEIENCQVIFQHDDINACDNRLLMTDIATPKMYSKVFKGRSDMGFRTGTIISTEFLFRGLHGYLVEGDDTIPIAGRGDCGTVVKLQKEINGKLRGVAMVVGGVLKIPNIEEDITVTIPLHRAIAKYESDTGNKLSFNNE